MHPRMWFALSAARAFCWLILSLLPTCSMDMDNDRKKFIVKN